MAAGAGKPVALITGGTSGIGLAAAKALQDGGFQVLVTGVNPETLAAAQQMLPHDVVVLKANARSISDAAHVADEIKQRFGRIDFAFFNAGVGRMLPIEVVDEAAFDEHFDVNIRGRFFALQKLLPLFETGS